MSHTDTLQVSWEEATEMSVELGRSITEKIESGAKPAYSRVICLLRGGLHSTNIISRMLGMRTEQVLAMGVSKYDHTQNERPEHNITISQIPTDEFISGQQILIIDDLVRTGETAACAEGILRGLGATGVDLAVIFDKSAHYNAVRIPDYSVEQTNHWIEFPWQAFDSPGPAVQP